MLSPELLTGLLMVVCTAGVFWFVAGALRNRTRAVRELARLQPLLDHLGKERTGAWVAPGTLRVTVERGRGPISRATVVLLLEQRELSVLWLLSRLRGRKDVLVARCELRRAPSTW